MCKCKKCLNEITDDNYKVEFWTDEHPEIIIGPYCQDCLSTIRICSVCNKPHLYEDGGVVDGKRFCKDCSIICEDCGRYCSDISNINGVKVCDRCLRNYAICGVCKNYHHKDRLVSKKSLRGLERGGIFRKYGNYICEGCFEENKTKFKKHDIVECKRCGSLVKLSDSEGGYCKRCFEQTDICYICKERNHSFSDIHICREEGLIRVKKCHSCDTKGLSKCHFCNGFVEDKKCLVSVKSLFSIVKVNKHHLKNPYIGVCKSCTSLSTINSEGVCINCVEHKCVSCSQLLDRNGNCRVCNDSRIYNYSYKESLKFLKTEKEVLFGNILMGFENEVSFGDTYRSVEVIVKDIYKKYDVSQVTLKSDGSIKGIGFEIVSQPMTLKYLKDFDLSGLFYKSYKEGKGCGFHIHVNKESFISDIHLLKVISFINGDKNEGFVTKIAGRGSCSYSKKYDKKISTAVKSSKYSCTERYLNVNLGNKNTVEFRLFIGCITEFQLRYRMEFIHSLISYTRDTSISKVTEESFRSFVIQNKKDYYNLYTFLGSL